MSRVRLRDHLMIFIVFGSPRVSTSISFRSQLMVRIVFVLPASFFFTGQYHAR